MQTEFKLSFRVNTRHLARRLADRSFAEVLIGRSGTVVEHAGDLKQAFRETLALELKEPHPMVLALLNSSNAVLEAAVCPRELAQKIRAAIYAEDKIALKTLIAELLTISG